MNKEQLTPEEFLKKRYPNISFSGMFPTTIIDLEVDKLCELLAEYSANQSKCISEPKDILEHFITWYNSKPKAAKGELIYTTDIANYLKHHNRI